MKCDRCCNLGVFAIWGVHCVDLALDIGREIAFVFLLKVQELPIVARNGFTAVWLPTRTGHIKRGMTIAHRVIETDLLVGGDVAHGDQRNLALESGVGIARVIHAIGIVVDQRAAQMMVDLNLDGASLHDLRLLVQLIGGDDNPAPDGEQLTFGYIFSREQATAIGRFATLRLWIMPGKLCKFGQGFIASGV